METTGSICFCHAQVAGLVKALQVISMSPLIAHRNFWLLELMFLYTLDVQHICPVIVAYFVQLCQLMSNYSLLFAATSEQLLLWVVATACEMLDGQRLCLCMITVNSV